MTRWASVEVVERARRRRDILNEEEEEEEEEEERKKKVGEMHFQQPAAPARPPSGRRANKHTRAHARTHARKNPQKHEETRKAARICERVTLWPLSAQLWPSKSMRNVHRRRPLSLLSLYFSLHLPLSVCMCVCGWVGGCLSCPSLFSSSPCRQSEPKARAISEHHRQLRAAHHDQRSFFFFAFFFLPNTHSLTHSLLTRSQQLHPSLGARERKRKSKQRDGETAREKERQRERVTEAHHSLAYS